MEKRGGNPHTAQSSNQENKTTSRRNKIRQDTEDQTTTKIKQEVNESDKQENKINLTRKTEEGRRTFKEIRQTQRQD